MTTIKKLLFSFLLGLLLIPSVLLGQQTLSPNLQFQIPAYNQANWQVPIDYNFLPILDTVLGGYSVLPTGSTPIVGYSTNYVTANLSSTIITNFLQGYPGQTIRLICPSADTSTSISNSANISLASTFICNGGGAISITLTLINTVWTEVARGSPGGGGGSGSTVTVNGAPLSMPSIANFQNGTSPVTGISINFSNPLSGNIQAAISGTLTDAGLTSAYSGTGICATNYFVNTLSRNSAPTCGRPTLANLAAGVAADVSGPYDFSGVTIKVPASSGFLATSSSTLGIDNTAQNLIVWEGVSTIIPYAVSPGSWVNGDCPLIVVSGSRFGVGDNGTPCGSGGSSIFTSYQFASATAITGTANYLQTTYPSEFATAQTGAGTSGSPYIDAITNASEAIHTFAAGPSSGGSAAWAFRTIVSADIPTLNQSTTGNAATATALAATPTLCSSTQAAIGVNASGNAQGCFTPVGGGSPTVNGSPLITPGTANFQNFTGASASAVTVSNPGTNNVQWNITNLVNPTNPGTGVMTGTQTSALTGDIWTYQGSGIWGNNTLGIPVNYVTTSSVPITTTQRGNAFLLQPGCTALTVAQAGSAGFLSNFDVSLIWNQSCSSTATLTPTTSNIYGGSGNSGATTSVNILPHDLCSLYSDPLANSGSGSYYLPCVDSVLLSPGPIGSVTPNSGAFTTMLATGIVDGNAPITVTTGSSATLGGTYHSGYTYNQEATAATAVTYTLPTAAAGKQYCVANSYNGSAATTGQLEILTSASGQFIIFTDGTLSATGGYVQSAGAAGDKACVVGVDSTHWMFYAQAGSWNKH